MLEQSRKVGGQRGFTLLEILVALVIGVLLIALVPPLLSGLGGATEVRSAARQLAAGLRSARNEAVTRHRARQSPQHSIASAPRTRANYSPGRCRRRPAPAWS